MNTSNAGGIHAPLTKILATLGPATDDPRVLAKLVEHGATLFRLNFSHGTMEDHAARLAAVRALEIQSGATLAVLGDLPGPKIRLKVVPPDEGGIGIMLEPGQDVLVTGLGDACVPGPLPTIVCNYGPIAAEVDPGQRVLINDGAVRMLAVVSDGERLLCRVTAGGLLTSGKGLNLPDSNLSIPATTERDLELARWSIEHGIDFLALSFVRRADEIRSINERLHRACLLRPGPAGPQAGEALAQRAAATPIIAKIETPQAVANIDQIMLEADGIMVARGDLGVEMEIAKVPAIQKMLVRKAQEYARPCIVATQMLESMIQNSSPTRAEVSDVANAIYDGADAVMLSGETAVGKYPVLAVEIMRRVASETEASLRGAVQEPRPPARPREARHRVPALAHGAWHMAQDVGAVLAAVWSQDGEAARYLSRNGFQMPILAFTTDASASRRMALYLAVHPVLVTTAPEHRSDFARMVDRHILDLRLASLGDPVVILGGKPFEDPGSTNTAAIRFVGEMTFGER